MSVPIIILIAIFGIVGIGIALRLLNFLMRIIFNGWAVILRILSAIPLAKRLRDS